MRSRAVVGIVLVMVALAPAGAGAQTPAEAPGAGGGVVLGEVRSGESPVPWAQVEVRGTAVSTVADSAGRFLLRLTPGSYVLLVSGLGYGVAEVPVTVAGGASERVVVRLRASAVAMSPIVVTGTLRETHVRESPVKVEVVSGRFLGRKLSENLMESIEHVNGLYRQVDCGVCYTDNIRINGMEGPYTAVLIDGMPIMSSLASVYGLTGINPALVERLEVIKGPASTLYGTEAMGGVINVIMKDPRFAPRVAVDTRRTSSGRLTVDAAAAPAIGEVRALLSGTAVRSDRFLDRNGDGFSDAPLESRGTLFGRVDWAPAGRRVLSLTGKLYREDRFGGEEAWTAAHRGSAEIYGESILTDRAELLASVRPDDRLRADFSWTTHHQNSWYGDQRFVARQRVAFGTATWSATPSQRHGLLLGATFRHEVYDDDTPATATAERRLIPGVFAQHEYTPSADLTLLSGLRLDRHGEHGAIVSPRASVKWQAGHHTVVRLNGGTGFRVVNLFTEDHAALTGSREVVIAETLRPERSWSVAANLNHTFVLDGGEAMLDVDLFHTRFSNRIISDYDTDPDLIIYENLSGHAVSRGAAVALNQVFFESGLSYDLGVTLQDVAVVEEGARERQLFSPTYTGVFSASWSPVPRLTLDYAARLTGPMRLPRYPAPHTRATRSRPYSVHNVQAAVEVGGGIDVYAAVRNLFDFRQGSPLVDPDNPFGDAFDTTYVWGPIVGREVVLGARWGVSR